MEKARKGAPSAAGRGKEFPGKWLLSWIPKGKGKRASHGKERRNCRIGNWF